VFDQISYDKGASFILMTSYMLGEHVMQEAASTYLNKFKYKNTSLDDFIDCLEAAYIKHNDNEFNVRQWTDSWLKTKGLNIITPRITYSEDGNTISKFELVQSFEKNSDPVYRMQKINIAFYNKDHDDTIFSGVLVKDEEVTEVDELRGKLVPEGILLNANNYGYCKIGFDEKSVSYFRDNTQHIQSDINRNLIYRYLWQHYKANQMKFSDYFALIRNSIKSESSMNAIVQLLTNLEKYTFRYTQPGEERVEFTHKVFDIVIDLLKSKTDRQDQNQIANFAVDFVPSDKLAFEYLQKGTICDQNGKVVIEGYKLTFEQKASLMPRIYSSKEIEENLREDFKSVSELYYCIETN
jgi:aminopeptidase N